MLFLAGSSLTLYLSSILCKWWLLWLFSHVYCLWSDCSTPGLSVPHQLLKLSQAHVHCIGDTSNCLMLWCPISPSFAFFQSSSSTDCMRSEWCLRAQMNAFLFWYGVYGRDCKIAVLYLIFLFSDWDKEVPKVIWVLSTIFVYKMPPIPTKSLNHGNV